MQNIQGRLFPTSRQTATAYSPVCRLCDKISIEYNEPYNVKIVLIGIASTTAQANLGSLNFFR
jgi:hypothetical protein